MIYLFINIKIIMNKIKEILRITSLPVLFASMCCLSPIIIFIFWLGSLSFVSSLTDTLYGDYKWYFRSIGLLLLAISLFFHFKRKWICTLDQVKKQRNKVINTILTVIISSILAYIFFLYIVVHYIWVFLDIWK